MTKLTQKGIPATLLGSAQKRDVTTEIKDGQYRIVFTTPESFLDRVTQTPLALLTWLKVERYAWWQKMRLTCCKAGKHSGTLIVLS